MSSTGNVEDGTSSSTSDYSSTSDGSKSSSLNVLCFLKITPFIQIDDVAVVIATHRTKQHSIAHARTHARTQHSASPGWIQAAVANSSHENGACRSYGSVLFAQGKKQ